MHQVTSITQSDLSKPQEYKTFKHSFGILIQPKTLIFLTREREVQINENNRQRSPKLTERIPHPVGTNAKMHANMSGIDKFVKATATAKPAIANKKERPWMKRNKSWKLTEIFWLNVKTCKTKDEMKSSNHR